MNEINVVLLDVKEIAVILFAVFSVANGIMTFLSLAGIKFEWEQGKIRIIKIKKKMVITPIVLFLLFAGMALYVSSLVEVPNVEGKIYSDAKNILIECGLDFNTIQNKEGNIVVVQSPKAESVVVRESKIELTLLEKEIKPEPKVYYRYRDIITVISKEKEMPGYILSDVIEEWSDYSEWSDWDITPISSSENTKIETKEQYRYREKEFVAGSSDTMPGYTLYNVIEKWSDYSGWSDWDITPISSSEDTKIETKEQYRYRKKLKTASNNSMMKDWTLYNTTFIWGDWSDWSTTKVDASENREVELKEVYKYRYRRTCWYSSSGQFCSSRLAPSGYTLASRSEVKQGTKNYYIEYSRWVSESERPEGEERIGQDGKPYIAYMVDGITYYLPEESQLVESSYRFRNKEYTYYFWKWDDWSDWSDMSKAVSEDVEVEERITYRYAVRSKKYTYYFWKWGNWSEWGNTKVYASETKEVENCTLYRYATRSKVYAYYFKKYSPWSEWSTEKPNDMENREIEVKQE